VTRSNRALQKKQFQRVGECATLIVEKLLELMPDRTRRAMSPTPGPAAELHSVRFSLTNKISIKPMIPLSQHLAEELGLS
jgi:hypothetical protein